MAYRSWGGICPCMGGAELLRRSGEEMMEHGACEQLLQNNRLFQIKVAYPLSFGDHFPPTLFQIMAGPGESVFAHWDIIFCKTGWAFQRWWGQGKGYLCSIRDQALQTRSETFRCRSAQSKGHLLQDLRSALQTFPLLFRLFLAHLFGLFHLMVGAEPRVGTFVRTIWIHSCPPYEAVPPLFDSS
jgi:hypothetical protein